MRINDGEKTLALLIPTKDRMESLKFYLEKRGEIFGRHHIDIIVYDSSDNNETQKYIDNYVKMHDAVKIVYHRFKDGAEDIHGVRKVLTAIKETAVIYDYVWLCGDQAVIDIEKCYDRLKKRIQEQYDVIHIYHNNLGITDRSYDDETEFFSCFFWSMTLWGASVLSRRLILDMESYINHYLKTGGVNPIVFSVFSLLSEKQHTIFYIYVERLIEAPPTRTLSNAYTKKDMMNGWIKMIYHGFNFLPGSYDNAKPMALNGVKHNIGILSYFGAIQLRATGNIDLNQYNENKEAIKLLSSCPMRWIKLWCMIPIAFSGVVYKLLYIVRPVFSGMKKLVVKTRA